MRLAVASVMALLLGCEARRVGEPHPDDGDAESSTGAADTGVAQVAPDGGAQQSMRLGPWVRDSTVPAPYGAASTFHSPQAGDLWLEVRDFAGQDHLALHHRSASGWASVFELEMHSPATVWIRSPQEAWILEWTGALHVVTPSGDAVTDLSHPDRIYTAVADGWIAYQQTSDTPSTTCRVIRFLRQTDSGFTDVQGPEACGWAVTSIYGTAAVTVIGEVLSWNGSTWKITDRLPPVGSTHYGTLSGSGPEDLYLLGYSEHGQSVLPYHFDGAAWNPFHFDKSSFSAFFVSLWARPWGPRWALNDRNAFERDDAGWHDRGPMPTELAHESPGPSGIGSDGTDVFVTGEFVHSGSGVPSAIWVYRYAP